MHSLTESPHVCDGRRPTLPYLTDCVAGEDTPGDGAAPAAGDAEDNDRARRFRCLLSNVVANVAMDRASSMRSLRTQASMSWGISRSSTSFSHEAIGRATPRQYGAKARIIEGALVRLRRGCQTWAVKTTGERETVTNPGDNEADNPALLESLEHEDETHP